MILRTLATTAMLLTPFMAQAQTNETAKVDIVPGWQNADGSYTAGLRITLADGWKTYWRAPGDAGIPPSFDWGASKNLRGVQVSWPSPKVFDQNGLRSVGYSNKVILPIRAFPKRSGTDVTLAGRVDIGVCKDICIPLTASFNAALPAGQTKRAPQLLAAMADRPYSQKEAKVGKVTCTISPTADGLAIAAVVAMPSIGGGEFAVLETGNPLHWVAEAKSARQGAALHITTEIAHFEGKPIVLDRKALRITVLGKGHAVDIRGCAAP